MNDRERTEIAAVLKRRSERNSGNRELARSLLLGRDVYDDDGRLRPAYGGEPRDE